jgi:transcriptional regulator with XRE-family HTH domain
MKNLNNIIGKRIRQVRKNLGLKQDKFANQLGCGRSNISQIENGLFYPTAKSLIVLKSKFNVNLDWLFSGEGSMFIEENEKNIDLLDFKEYSNDIKTMLQEMKNSKSIMHRVLAKFFEIKLEKNPNISVGEGQKIKNEAMEKA